MYPEDRLNPMGISQQGAANMLGTMSPEVPAEAPAPVDGQLKAVAIQFSSAWKALEGLNTQFGGDSDRFKDMLKAAESWFADLASRLPESQESTQAQPPTY